MTQTVKNLLAMQETGFQSLGEEDPLEKGVATHSTILAWTEEPGELQSMGSERVKHTERLTLLLPWLCLLLTMWELEVVI